MNFTDGVCVFLLCICTHLHICVCNCVFLCFYLLKDQINTVWQSQNFSLIACVEKENNPRENISSQVPSFLNYVRDQGFQKG